MLLEICIGLHCNSGHLCHEVARHQDCWTECLHGCGYERPAIPFNKGSNAWHRTLHRFCLSLSVGCSRSTNSTNSNITYTVLSIPTHLGSDPDPLFTSSTPYTFIKKHNELSISMRVKRVLSSLCRGLYLKCLENEKRRVMMNENTHHCCHRPYLSILLIPRKVRSPSRDTELNIFERMDQKDSQVLE